MNPLPVILACGLAAPLLAAEAPKYSANTNQDPAARAAAVLPAMPSEGIEHRDLSGDAQTINQRGLTIVPLEVRTLDNGDIRIRALDPAYATPGPDEVQKF